jgi:hypothetical protein
MTTKKIDQEQRARINEIHKNTARIQMLFWQQLDIYAEKRGWNLTGMDVLYKLFAEKYHWTPAQVRSLTQNEVDALLEGEKDFSS